MIRTADSCELACAPVDVAVAMATEILASMVAWSATAAEMYDESPNDVASPVDATLVSEQDGCPSLPTEHKFLCTNRA